MRLKKKVDKFLSVSGTNFKGADKNKTAVYESDPPKGGCI